MAWAQDYQPTIDPNTNAAAFQEPLARTTLKVENSLANAIKCSPESSDTLQPNSCVNGNNDAGNNISTAAPSVGVMLPDYLKEDLDIVVIGINPSLGSGNICHHYAGTGNHFWTCLYESRLVPVPVDFKDDATVLKYGIGFTNICARSSKGTSDLSRKDVKEGSAAMLEKIRHYNPKIAVFNGKGIYETYVGHKNFSMGKQPEPLEGTNTVIFVMPSSSARCAQLPRAEDKLPFFVALRKLREHLRGERPHLEEAEVVFADYTEFRVTTPDPKSLRKAERRRKRKSEAAAAAAALEQSNRGLDGSVLESASPRKKKKPTPAISLQQSDMDMEAMATAAAGAAATTKNIAAPSAFISAEQFQLHQQQQQQHHFQTQSLMQTHAPTAPHHAQQLFAMQPAAQFHPHPQHQMFVSANGQLMAATPMVSIAMPTAGQQAAAAAAAAAAATGCYGAPFQQFIMSQSATGQPAGMVAWQPTTAWSAYQHAATATAPPPQQTPQQFVFAGGQPAAPAYPQHVYLAPASNPASGTPASYHLLPVGCHPQTGFNPQTGFTGVFVPDQHHAPQGHQPAPQPVAVAAAGQSLIPSVDPTQAATAPQQAPLITLGSPHFKVMAVGAGGQLIPAAAATPCVPHFVPPPAAPVVPPQKSLAGTVKVSAVTQTPNSLQTSSVPLVQTAAGSDEGGQAASSASDEKVIYSAL
uniref:G/T mismatch-specific thymine DNA glycosylase n=1 Tax=Mesocestoides corti TaxID=53468 RepID=A0A5K3FRL2_MESCO